MSAGLMIAVYALPFALIAAVYLGFARRTERRNERIRDEAIAAGLGEPATLHPKIDPAKCMACGSCVAACPEGQVLGLINNRAELIEPSLCIGHGACAAACPFDAISLVFGTEKRGVDLPHVGADFQTNVPGIYIAGELGGMGLIRNAVEQGRQAMEMIAGSLGKAGEGSAMPFDVVVVGAGPAGFSASLAAMQHKLRFVTLEQESFGGTVAHFPRGKIVMTAPAILPLYGRMKFRETTKETLLGLWYDVMEKSGLRVRYGEAVERVTPIAGGFEVKTNNAVYPARSVLLAIGRRGTPRKLGVPGEELPKVVYHLIDAEQYRGQHVLVVGGGDSALEAAGSIAGQPGTSVSLAYRSQAFSRAKPKNRQRVDEMQRTGRLQVLFETNVTGIEPQQVHLERKGEALSLQNDAIIVCAGGILPTKFLEETGIAIERKFGTA